MSCCTLTTEKTNENTNKDINGQYESVDDISDYYVMKKNQTEDFYYSVLDLKYIINCIPRDIFNIFNFSINVFTSETKTLSSCEVSHIRTNIKIKPFFPLNTSITFQGVINGLSFKSSNQTIIPLNEEIFYVRIQNFGRITQTIPLNMPLGKIVITSKEHWDL
jgi:hypothetical protein